MSQLAASAMTGRSHAKLITDLQAQLAGRRLIFCLTNGRSGSNRVGDLFKAVRGADARHEPAPYFDTLRREAASDASIATNFLLRMKLPYIATTKAPTYVETSHLFAKGFFRAMLSTGIPFDAIALRRNRRMTALSLLSLGHRPGRSGISLRFLIAPDEAECLPLSHPEQLTDYQLLYWHVLEQEARIDVYAAELRAAGGRVAEVSLEELQSAERFHKLLADLGLDSSAVDARSLSDRIAAKSNLKSRKRKWIDLTDDELDAQERALHEMLAGGSS